MNQEKYNTFKNLGFSENISPHVEMVTLPNKVMITYDHRTNNLRMTRSIEFADTIIKIACQEKGKRTVESEYFVFFLRSIEGKHFITCVKDDIDFCLKHKIIIALEEGTPEKELSFCGVEFNELLDVDFNDTSAEITKYFS
jgi:hypothetical protein